MSELNDHELLAEFARSESGTAFATLVERHVNLVHSTALRFTGNPHHAEEITQAVFIILARKAGTLSSRVVLSGWLYQAARLTAANLVKGEIRRQRREQEAYMQTILNEPDVMIWKQIAPLLDDAMGNLGETDRNAVVLRFFENKTAAEVAAALKLSEAAAHKRVNRALEKLRKFFTKRGIALSSVAITGAISANSVQAAPVALAKSVTAVAIVKGAAASASTLTLIKGALKIMAWSKTQTAIIAGAVVLLAAGTTTLVVTKMQSSSLDTYLQDPELNAISNAPPMVTIQLTHFPGVNSKPGSGIVGRTDGAREIGRNIFLSTAILKAYRFPSWRRMICPEEVNRTSVDYLVTVPDRPYERFQAEIKRKFGYIAHIETREVNVFLLRVKRPNAPGLTPADNSSWQEWSAKHPQRSGIDHHNMTLSRFAESIEPLVPKPVVDGTGLTGNYDFITQSFGPDEINQVFMDQLGLELVPTNMPIEMLVVEKAK